MTLLLQGLNALGIGFAFGYGIGSIVVGNYGLGVVAFGVFTALVVLRGLQ